jgi:hypothetical protein
MRTAQIALVLIAATLPALSQQQARAADGFNIVVPGRRGVPIIINGVDASYSVIEGDWGLERGIHIQPTIYGGRYIDPEPRVGHYYPSAGHQPGYGRLEIEPPKNRKLPQPAESFHESWSAQSPPPMDQNNVPFNPPAVIDGQQNFQNQNFQQQNLQGQNPQGNFQPRNAQRPNSRRQNMRRQTSSRRSGRSAKPK